MRASAVAFLLSLLLAGGGSWDLPEPVAIGLVAAITTSEKSYNIILDSEVDEEKAAGPERVEPDLKSHEKRSLAKCRKLIAAGDTEKAEKILGSLMRRNKGNHDASALRARCRLRAGDTERALEYITASIIGNRRNPEAWEVLEELAKKLGRKVVRPRLVPGGWIEGPNEKGEISIRYDADEDEDFPWLYYGVARAYYRQEGPFERDFPKLEEYRFTFYEQLYAVGALLQGSEGKKVSKGIERLQAERKAGTIVPFVFFAIYPEPIPKKPEPRFDDLLPVLEKYFDEHILVPKAE
jgi:tetratricopeptide (TPR) repeat protein